MFISGQSSNISHKRTRTKQRGNTTNVPPHITSTGNCTRSLSGANFYTSLRLVFSLTLNLIGKRRERKQQSQASIKISPAKRASPVVGWRYVRWYVGCVALLLYAQMENCRILTHVVRKEYRFDKTRNKNATLVCTLLRKEELLNSDKGWLVSAKALASSSLEKREWRGFHSQREIETRRRARNQPNRPPYTSQHQAADGGLVNEVTVAALVTALVSRLEGKLDGAEPGHRHVRNKDQSGTTTSGNLVGAAIRPRNLGANLKAKIQEGRNGVTSSNYRKQLLFQLTTRDYARRFRNDLNPCQNPYTDTTIVLQKFHHASRHTHRDFPHPKKAGKDQIRQDTAVWPIVSRCLQKAAG
ncbi:hypothetical protein T4E_10829 [Trichinella pseudospiralis]|uniref:Uncharacterized protein n=1 Tax=Trichinella pseudospiralis TaxID=6337 RepID=A0A0V0XU64_TRIPS|nr:hypothetical protein T4E_10829 [Trichinella pseudospiralis]